MNATEFMDKQGMGLSASQKNEFLELLKKDDILPNYDFQQVEPKSTVSPVSIPSDLKPKLAPTFGSLEHGEPMKASDEQDTDDDDKSKVSEIDQAMKTIFDKLLRTMEGISARLTDLESRTHQLEFSVGGLKLSVVSHHRSTDEKLGQMENVLGEIIVGIKMLQEKQEAVEARSKFSERQLSKVDFEAPEALKSTQEDYEQQVNPPVPQAIQVSPHQSPLPGFPLPPNAPLRNAQPPPQHITPSELSAPQFPLSQSPFDAPSPLAPLSEPPLHPQYQLLPQPYEPQEKQFHLPQLSVQPPHHCQMTPDMMQAPSPTGNLLPLPYLQRPQQNQPHSGSSSSSLYPSHRQEETVPYLPSQPYLPDSCHTVPQPPAVFPASRPFYDDRPPMNPSPLPTSAPNGESGYPAAQSLPHALPATSGVIGTSSSTSGNRVPIDDVVDTVSTMGFSKEQVRAAVEKLIEDGQSVELNAVLDKLMNDG